MSSVTFKGFVVFRVFSLDVALCVAIETGRGLPGRPGPPAVPAVELVSRCASAPAATQVLATGGVCAWARTERRGK